ncbi:MAG: LamG-like jellyroll fold domain-containing protein [Bacilli bacterium]
MTKKKGFTLIEVLSVIVLLGLLTTIVFQVFSKQFEDAKQDAYKRQVQTIINLAKDYHLQNINETGVFLDTLDDKKFVKQADLIDPRNKSSMSGCVVFTNNIYNQVEYIYQPNMNECIGTYLIKGYLSKNLVLHYDALNNGGYDSKTNSSEWIDLSGNNNDGKLINFGNTINSGWQNDSLAFDGSDDGVFLENKLSLIFQTNNTFEMVVKFNDSSRTILFGNFNDANSINYERSNNKFRVYWNNGGVDSFNVKPFNNMTKYVISCVNNKNDGQIKLYVNGILDYTFTNSALSLKNFKWNSAYIGRDSRTGETVLNGNIYSVRIYKEALTKEQIMRNYNIDKKMYHF